MTSIRPPRLHHATSEPESSLARLFRRGELPPVAAAAARAGTRGRGWLNFPHYPSLLLVLLTVAAMLSHGCARLTQTLSTTTVLTNGVVETRLSKATGWALFDSKNSLEKLRVSNGKTHSIGLSGMEQEASSTNAAATLDAVTRLLQAVK